MTKVSVVLAVYNSNLFYLQSQLDSIENQVRQPDELIITDDNSSNDTLIFLKKYSKNSSLNVKIITNNKNVGYSQNFMNGIKVATGDVIFLCDQDDIWDRDKIKAISNYFIDDESSLVVIHDQTRTNQDLIPERLTTIRALAKRGIPTHEFVYGCATAFHRKILPFVLDCPDNVAYDNWIHLIGRIFNKRLIVPKCYMLFRRHPESTTIKPILAREANINLFTSFYAKLYNYRKIWHANSEQEHLIRANLKQSILNIHGKMPHMNTNMLQDGLNRIEAEIVFFKKRSILLGENKLNALKSIFSINLFNYRLVGGMRILLRDLASTALFATRLKI